VKALSQCNGDFPVILAGLFLDIMAMYSISFVKVYRSTPTSRGAWKFLFATSSSIALSRNNSATSFLRRWFFFPQVIEAFCLLQQQPTVFLAPAVIALLTDAGYPNGMRHSLARANKYLDLPQLGDDLPRGKCLSWQIQLLCCEDHCLSHKLD